MDSKINVKSVIPTLICDDPDFANLDVGVDLSEGAEVFLQSLLHGEFHIPQHQSKPSSVSVVSKPPMAQYQKITTGPLAKKPEIGKGHTFKKNSELLHRSSQIIKLSIAKQFLLKELPSIATYPTTSVVTKRAPPLHSIRGTIPDLYAKPRLPFLRTKNRENINDLSKVGIAKKFEPSSFNASFRRRLRKSLKEEEAMVSAGTTASESNETSLKQQEGNQGGDDAKGQTKILSSKEMQNEILSTSSIASRNISFDKKFPDSKIPQGLEDFTFLLSPESQVSTDIDQGKDYELNESVGRPEKEKRILDYILDTLKGNSDPHKRILHTIDDTMYDGNNIEVAEYIEYPACPSEIHPRQSIHAEVEGSCSVVADRAFLQAKRILSKKDRGRPLACEDRKLEAVLSSTRKQETSHSKFKLGARQSSIELFAQYMELRKEAAKGGIPVQCLPTMPKGASDIRSAVHKEYFTTERLQELIDHVTSLKFMEDSNFNFDSECDSISPKLYDPGMKNSIENDNFDLEELSWLDLLNDTENLDQVAEDDLFSISANVVSGGNGTPLDGKKDMLDFKFMMNANADDGESDEDALSTKVRKILSERIFKEEDLISEISGARARNVRKRPSVFKKDPGTISIRSITESSEDGESISSTKVRRILRKTIFNDHDLISEITSTRAIGINNQQNGATKAVVAELSQKSLDDEKSSVLEVEKILQDRVIEVDLVSDIQSICVGRRKSKNRKAIVCGDTAETPVDVDVVPQCTDDQENMSCPTDEDEDVSSGTDSISEDVDCSDISEDIEIPNEGKHEAEFKGYDDLGLNIWGPMRNSERRNSKPDTLDYLDELSLRSGMVDEDTRMHLKQQITNEVGVSPETYDEFENEFSVDRGKHPCTLMVLKKFQGPLTTISKNPPLEFNSWKKSHTLHMFSKYGFLNKELVGFPNCRVTEQIGNKKERIPSFKRKASQSRKSGSKLILKVSISHYNPGEHLEQLGNKYFTSKWATPTAQLEFSEHQLVLDIRNSLHCIKDCITTKGYDTTEGVGKFLTLDDIAYNKNPDWYMIIRRTILYDGRHPGSLEAAHQFLLYANKTFNQQFRVLDAAKTHLGDLSIRFGYPYRLFHQGGCMHTIVFNGARLSEDDEELNSAFPKYVHENTFPDVIKCEFDDIANAEWIVTRSSKLEDRNYLFTCKECADEVLNSEDKNQNISWRTSFRIQYDSAGIGKVPDQNVGWKSIPHIFTRAKSCELIKSNCQPKPRTIYIQVPELELSGARLYRFIQPFLLHKFIHKYGKKPQPTRKPVPEIPKTVPVPKKRGRKPKAKKSNPRAKN